MQDILIIDDDNAFREVASLVLEDKGYRVRMATCAEEAYAILIAGERFDLIFCDLHMPVSNGARQENFRYSVDVGYRMAKELANILPDCSVVVLSALPPSDIMRLVPHLYPIQAFSKPTTPKDLLALLDDAAVVQ